MNVELADHFAFLLGRTVLRFVLGWLGARAASTLTPGTCTGWQAEGWQEEMSGEPWG